MNDEIWKPIKGLEGLYEVSNKARIRTVPRIVTKKNGRKMRVSAKIRKQSLDWKGYLYVKIQKDGRQISLRVHRAMMEAFIPNPEKKMFVDHINTIKSDNRLENLRWVSSKENSNNPLTIQHIKDTLTLEEIERQKKVKKDNGTWNGKKVFQYTKDGQFVAQYETLSDAIRAINKDVRKCTGNISIAIDKQNKSAYGYKWYSKRIEPTQ